DPSPMVTASPVPRRRARASCCFIDSPFTCAGRQGPTSHSSRGSCIPRNDAPDAPCVRGTTIRPTRSGCVAGPYRLPVPVGGPVELLAAQAVGGHAVLLDHRGVGAHLNTGPVVGVLVVGQGAVHAVGVGRVVELQ